MTGIPFYGVDHPELFAIERVAMERDGLRSAVSMTCSSKEWPPTLGRRIGGKGATCGL